MKTLSKPLADRFKTWVMSHPEYRVRVLRAAEVAHRIEVGITRRAEGKEGAAFIGAMTEEKSVELASKIASEGFVFAVGALLVFAEYDRTRKKELRKQAREAAERRAARETLEAEARRREETLERLTARLDGVEAALRAFEEEQRRKQRQRGGWGGFFGPRGLDAPSMMAPAAAAGAAREAGN